MKKIISLLCLVTALSLIGCSRQSDPNTIKVGTIAGPETELMEVAKAVAKKEHGINIEIVTFSDYVMPNTALNEGSIDANMYQHEAYLKTAMKLHGYEFTAIAKTFIYPMAIYSKKMNSLDDLKSHAVIAIPNDPSNEARALFLLDKAGIIKLKAGSDFTATLLNIAYNPKGFIFKELDAAQLPRALGDVDLAVINTNYAFNADLLPKRDGLFIEASDSPYANLLVVRTKDKENPKFKKLISALHSKKVTDKAAALFKGQAIKAW